MPKFRKKHAKKAGLSPGSLIHVGEKKIENVRFHVVDYNENQFYEKEVKTIEECRHFKETPTNSWINVSGVHQVDIIEKVGGNFKFHSLVLEDILNTGTRPKMEDYEEYIFFVLKMPYFDQEKNEINIEQVSLILGTNFLISFQEKDSNIFDPVTERIRNGRKRIRKSRTDYLAYALIDNIVDHYFFILEKVGEKIAIIEEELMADTGKDTLHNIHKLKKELIFFRKSVWPLREIVNGIIRAESPLIKETTQIFLRDVYDHTMQLIDTMETYRDMLSGLIDLYLSTSSSKMNEVMKVLTIIATIFIPLTFIAGLYGMNFDNMPELKSKWGYPSILLAMVITGGSMLFYFKREKWL